MATTLEEATWQWQYPQFMQGMPGTRPRGNGDILWPDTDYPHGL